MIFEGFIGGAYKMDSLPISAQRCINWYPETTRDEGASSRRVLQPSPGYKEFIQIDDPDLPFRSFNRGIYRSSRGLGLVPEEGGSIFTVVGPYVYWLKGNPSGVWSYERVGSISNLTSKVSFSDDGFGMVIADGKNIYRLDLTTKEFGNVGFNLQNPVDVDFYDGYTITIGVDLSGQSPQNTFFWSGLYDNSSWDALDFASAEKSQDPITAFTVSGSYLYFFGPNSYELWSPTGDQDLPFQRAYASSGTVGIAAKKSLTKFGNNVFLLGSNGGGNTAAYMSQGTEMVKISTVPLEQEWQKNEVSDCTTWADSQDGHDFIYFNFDTLDKTYAYDIGENEWSERATRDPNTDTLHRWEPNFAAHRFNETIVGDRFSNKLYFLGTKYLTENGNNIQRVRTTGHLHAEQKPIMIEAVRLEMETGNGISDEDPEVSYVKNASYFSETQILMDYSSRGTFRRGTTVQFMGTLPTGLAPDTDYTISQVTDTGEALAITLDGVSISDDADTFRAITRKNRYSEAATLIYRYSHDQARTWSSEIRQTFGAAGEYLVTPEFTRHGVCRNYTAELKITDPVKTSINNAWIYTKVAQRGRK